MDKTLQVKVSMMVDLKEASNDIAKEINKLTILKTTFKILFLDLKGVNFIILFPPF